MKKNNYSHVSQFNTQQRKIIQEPLGVHCIIAGAGTGKTKILTSRIIHVIEQFNINCNRILAITFTNKAAKEIANRVKKLIPGLTFPWITTFHTFCRKFLSEEIGCLGRKKNFSIVDDEDQKNVVNTIYKEHSLDKTILSPKAIVNIINIKKCFNISLDDAINIFYADDTYSMQRIEKTQIAHQVYQWYESYLSRVNLVDFNDLLILTYRILTDFPDVRSRWQHRFDYVFIDEFQDTNQIQYEIILYIAQICRNVFVVGDPDQSIYAWRGADRNIESKFQKDFPESKIMLLEENYRSTRNILSVANNLIQNNTQRTNKKLFTNNIHHNDKVVYYNAYSQDDEAEWIASEINTLVKEKAIYQFSDIVVLYRSNYWSRSIEQSLIQHQIPYIVYGGVKFYQRKEIKDILAYMRTIIFHDDLSVLRIINTPSRKIGEKSLVLIKKFANEKQITIFEALVNHIQIIDLTSTVHKAIERFLTQLKTIETKSKLRFETIADVIVDVVNYKEALDSNIKFRMENLDQLTQAMISFAQNHQGVQLSDFLNEVSLFTSYDDHETDEKNCIKLMTIHTSKGLEFPCVFIAGLVEGVFPTSQSIASSDNCGNFEKIEEERRIAYVAITRAMRNLYLTSCGGYNFVKDQMMSISRFLQEINLLNLDTKFKKMQPIDKKILSDNNDWFDSKAKDLVGQLYDFDVNIKEGEIIVHKVFGTGMVIKLDGQYIDVKFNDVKIGTKTLLKNHRSIVRKLS